MGAEEGMQGGLGEGGKWRIGIPFTRRHSVITWVRFWQVRARTGEKGERSETELESLDGEDSQEQSPGGKLIPGLRR